MTFCPEYEAPDKKIDIDFKYIQMPRIKGNYIRGLLIKKLIRYVVDNPQLTSTQIAKALGRRVDTVHSTLKRLADRGVIRRTPDCGIRGGFGHEWIGGEVDIDKDINMTLASAMASNTMTRGVYEEMHKAILDGAEDESK